MPDDVGNTPGTATGTQGQPAATPPPSGTGASGTPSGQGKQGQTVPAGTAGQDAGTQGKTDAEPTFMDPKDLDPALMPHYKNMQKAFSKKTQEIASFRQKAEAYDNFAKDPISNLQNMAARMGYKLQRADEPQAKPVADDWQPQTWPELFDKLKGTIAPALRQEIMQEMQPAISELQRLRKTNIEKLLDDSCPDWRQYEEDMMSNLKEHPSLVNDPVKLYRLSVPQEVVETAAFQRALKKLEDKAKGSQTGGTSTTNKHQTPGPGNISNFDDAVKYAKARLAEQGIRPPGT